MSSGSCRTRHGKETSQVRDASLKDPTKTGSPWQVNCFEDELSVKNKTKIRYKKVVNRPKSSGKSGRPNDVSKLYADIMSVVQHNGHVTLPGVPFSDGFLTNRPERAIGFLLGVLGLIALLKIANRLI
jgi:hypothetical protein